MLLKQLLVDWMKESDGWEEHTVESQMKPLKKKVLFFTFSLLSTGLVLLGVGILLLINPFEIDLEISIEVGSYLGYTGGGLIIMAIGYILTQGLLFRRKKRFKIPKFDGDEDIPELTEEMVEESEAELIAITAKSPRIVPNEEPTGKPVISFEGDIQGKRCSICKLELGKKQQIVACPYCLTPFHRSHLRDWLEKKKKCPICSMEISVPNA